jgi:hypothetical protein
LGIVWTLEGAFNAAGGAQNTYRWTVTLPPDVVQSSPATPITGTVNVNNGLITPAAPTTVETVIGTSGALYNRIVFTGATLLMQYSINNGVDWNNVTTDVMTNGIAIPTAGATVVVRLAAVTGSNASPATAVLLNVAARAGAPGVTLDTNVAEIPVGYVQLNNSTTLMEYRIGTGAWIVVPTNNTRIEAPLGANIFIRVRATATTQASAETPALVVNETNRGVYEGVSGFTFTPAADLRKGQPNVNTAAIVGAFSNPVGGVAPYTCSLVAGAGDTDNGRFTISGTNLIVGATALTEGTYNIRVQVASGASNHQVALTITVTAAAPTLENLTVGLVAGDGKVTLAPQTVVSGYTFHYVSSGATVAVPEYGANISTISSATEYTTATDIDGANGTAIFVRVYKVNAESEIVGFGEASATPEE